MSRKLNLRDARERLENRYFGVRGVERINSAVGAFRFEFKDHRWGRGEGVLLWNTVLLTTFPEGPTTITTGGWDTHTTMKYLNEGLSRLGLSAMRVRGKTLLHISRIANTYIGEGWMSDDRSFFELNEDLVL